MLFDRLTGWTRPAAALLALAGALALSACGGGSGSVNNPNTPTNPPSVPTLGTLPGGIVTAFSGVPTTIQIVGGLPPYTALSNNSAVLAVPFNVSGDMLVLVANPVPVGSTVPLAITVADQSGQATIANINVVYSPLFQSGLTVAPSSQNCGDNLCDGETAAVTAVATGIGGAPLPNRQIRFDAVFGPFAIVTNNPGTPLSPTLTVVTDAAGQAAVQIQATTNAPTQSAQIRATDVTTGQSQIANFIVQRQTGTNNLSVIPPTAVIQTQFNTSCSTGFLIDYYIFGGTPPYTVTASFPTGVAIVPSVVGASGGFFRATTNGTCVNPLTFAIVDAAGKTTTATLTNIPGSQTPPVPPVPTPPTLSVAPSSVTDAACSGKTFNFVITGGTPPYNVAVPATPPGIQVSPNPVPTSGSFVAVSGIATGAGTIPVVVGDSATAQQVRTVTINCQ